MSYKDKIIALAKSYEGEDKLGFLTKVDMDFKNEINIVHNRSRSDEGIQPKDIEIECWLVSLRYSSKKGAFGQTKVSTGTCKTLGQCYLILKGYLEVEVTRFNVRRDVMKGDITDANDKTSNGKTRDIFKELEVALKDENYELASKLRNEIDDDFGK